MSAVKLILKRSSILGKRPTRELLEAGELALNTNAVDPGLFFEVSDGQVVKAGPTAYLPEPPTLTPAKGELWVDTNSNQLNIGNGENQWEAVTSRFLSGSNGYSVFVAPNYELASDSLANDGQSAPFQTLNRAILEVSKYICQRAIANLPTVNLYTIYLLNGFSTISNGPGTPDLNTFDVDFSVGDQQDPVTQATLQQFNHPDGGVFVPRGVSIVGLDLKKCEVRPTYVPVYKYPGFPDNYQQDPPRRDNPTGGPLFNYNAPLSSVFRWTGETYLSNFSVRDKIDSRVVESVSLDTFGKVIFRTPLPHGLQYNDFIQFDVEPRTPNSPGLQEGQYYVEPLDAFTFYMARSSFVSPTALVPVNVYITQQDINLSLLSYTTQALFTVSNIYPYFTPRRELGVPIEPFELHNYSAHKLTLVKNAAIADLNLYYSKVQKAFPDLFRGEINTALAAPQETIIVSPTDRAYTTNPQLQSNLDANNTLFASAYMNQVNHRSNYGMGNMDADGDIVSGFKSVIVNSSTAVQLQNDPAAYEIYNSTSNDWVTLTETVAAQLNRAIFNVPTITQLRLLNTTALLDTRFYYETLGVDPNLPVSEDNPSTGLTDINNDFRHFGFRIRGLNAYMQAQSTYIIGAAVGCWAMNGAIMSLTNATTNFGWVAFQSEGFAGIGTIGGANQLNTGFLNSGIVRPLALTPQQCSEDAQKRILNLGSRVVEVLPDPLDPTIQRVYLNAPFNPASILPYSLGPGTAVYVEDIFAQYRGFLAIDGGPTVVMLDPALQRPYLRVRASDSTIPYRSSTSTYEFGYAYIRRFVDPRSEQDKQYALYVQSTNPLSQAPKVGAIVRLDQNSQTLGNTIRKNVQLDPVVGGYNQVFSVHEVATQESLLATNFNYKVTDNRQSTGYAIYISPADSGVPWIQALQLESIGFQNFNNPKNSYATYNNKNYFAIENNLWTALYYENNSEYTPVNGPQKVAPNLSASPFVPSVSTLRNIPVSLTYQGSVPDLFLPGYAQLTGTTPPAAAPAAYLRGATLPQQNISNQFVVDIDDGSASTGILYKTYPTTISTTTSAPSTTVQTAQAPTLWPPLETPTTPSFGRPMISSFILSSAATIPDPLTDTIVCLLAEGGDTEYIRIIDKDTATNTVTAIRNYYPSFLTTAGVITPTGLPEVVPAGATLTVCVDSPLPQPQEYDPIWGVSKVAVFRYYQVMGFSTAQLLQVLLPAFDGERITPNTLIPGEPSLQGYAAIKTGWPIEFNNPSYIIASTHSWLYCGYPVYSRGLPKYQTNLLPQKAYYDFLSTATWGGRITATGLNEEGDSIISGALRDSSTGYFAELPNVYVSYFNYISYNDIARSCSFVTLDSLTPQFNGVTVTFTLTRGGAPVSYLTDQLFVEVGGVPQVPLESFSIVGSEITFVEAPLSGATNSMRAFANCTGLG